jgi:hypothetical protein
MLLGHDKWDVLCERQIPKKGQTRCNIADQQMVRQNHLRWAAVRHLELIPYLEAADHGRSGAYHFFKYTKPPRSV